MKLSKYAERDIINKIAAKFAESMTSDVDVIFDMLLQNGEIYKVSKQHFKDYLLRTMNVREQDVDILLKTNRYLIGRDFMDKNDFRNIFEQAIIDARNALLEDENERLRRFNTAKRFLQSNAAGEPLGGNTFGMTGQAYNPFQPNDTLNDRDRGVLSEGPKRAITADLINNPVERQGTDISNVSGKAKMEEQKKRISVLEVIKDKAYTLINQFIQLIGPETPFATFD